MSIHEPVLLHETIEILDPQPGAFFIDGTLGGGGHANAMIARLGPTGLFLGVDWDKDAVREFAKAYAREKNVRVREASYIEIPAILREEKLPHANGLLLDLGFSSDQIENAARGFSFQEDGPLDMRYTREGMTAADLVNGASETELADIFWKFGDERFSRQIAKEIVTARRKEKIVRTVQLAEIVKRALPPRFQKGKTNPATKVFQALRIAVNREFENIETILSKLDECVTHGGKVAVITFHSTEDGIVKRAFQELVKTGRAKLLTKKPIVPTRSEVKQNPRSRSAKVRAIQLI